MSADIEPLPGVRWSAHAALGDALNRAPINSPCIIAWLDEEENVCYSVSATNMQTVWLCHQLISKVI